jgi:hypothetical protein
MRGLFGRWIGELEAEMHPAFSLAVFGNVQAARWIRKVALLRLCAFVALCLTQPLMSCFFLRRLVQAMVSKHVSSFKLLLGLEAQLQRYLTQLEGAIPLRNHSSR